MLVVMLNSSFVNLLVFFIFQLVFVTTDRTYPWMKGRGVDPSDVFHRRCCCRFCVCKVFSYHPFTPSKGRGVPRSERVGEWDGRQSPGEASGGRVGLS